MIQKTLFDPPSGGANLSSDQCYRYLLWRTWDDRPPLVFVMLNPSTADANTDDATVRRCQSYALAQGAGGLRIVNLFALRATDPAAIYLAANPIGVNNNVAICEAVRGAAMVICAWGCHGEHLDRARAVIQLLESQGVEMYCLRANKDGSPSHPLYLPGKLVPQRFIPASRLAISKPEAVRGNMPSTEGVKSQAARDNGFCRMVKALLKQDDATFTAVKIRITGKDSCKAMTPDELAALRVEMQRLGKDELAKKAKADGKRRREAAPPASKAHLWAKIDALLYAKNRTRTYLDGHIQTKIAKVTAWEFADEAILLKVRVALQIDAKRKPK